MVSVLLGVAALYLAWRPESWPVWGDHWWRARPSRAAQVRVRLRWMLAGVLLVALGLLLPMVSGRLPQRATAEGVPERSGMVEARFEIHAIPRRSALPGDRPGRLSERLLGPGAGPRRVE